MPPRFLSVIGVSLAVCVPLIAEEAGSASSQVSSEAQQTEEQSEVAGGERELFSEGQYSELYEKYTLPDPEISAETSAVETLEDVVELEPYVVEGDGGLMMARFRRRWDLGIDSIQKRVAELNEELGHQIQFSGRANERFFSEQSYGSVRDRPGTTQITAEQLKPIGKSILDALGSLRDGGK